MLFLMSKLASFSFSYFIFPVKPLCWLTVLQCDIHISWLLQYITSWPTLMLSPTGAFCVCCLAFDNLYLYMWPDSVKLSRCVRVVSPCLLFSSLLLHSHWSFSSGSVYLLNNSSFHLWGLGMPKRAIKDGAKSYGRGRMETGRGEMGKESCWRVHERFCSVFVGRAVRSLIILHAKEGRNTGFVFNG